MPRRTTPDGSSIPYRAGKGSGPGRPSAPGRPPGSGMGNPHEDRFFYEGWREYGPGDPRAVDAIFTPDCDPKSLSPEEKRKQAALKCTLNDVFARQVVFTKFPANVQPPYFARPIIKAKNITVPANTKAAIFDRDIPARTRAVLTMLGIDVDPVSSVLDQTCEFWFDLGSEKEIIPVFDDQTETAYEETDGVDSGKTTVLPGSLTIPFNFLQAGLQFQIKGPRMLRFMCHNKSDAAFTVRGIMGYYQYWLPYGADEFENADVQM